MSDAGETLFLAAHVPIIPVIVIERGSWLTPSDAIAAKDWQRVTRLAREASRLAPR